MTFHCFECDVPLSADEEDNVCSSCGLVYCSDCMAPPPRDEVCALCAADEEKRECR